MKLYRVTRKYVYLTMTATDAAGSPVTVADVSVAFLRPNRTPDRDTTWVPVTATDGRYRLLIAGPDADPAGAIVLPSTMNLWAKATDSPEVDATMIDTLQLA